MRSGLAQFLIETDNNFHKYEKETNALINEMTKQLYPIFWSIKTEYTRYGERPEEPVLQNECEPSSTQIDT